MKKFNVLVFPCGSVTAMDINFSLRHALRINLFGASSVDDHGKYIYKNYIGNVPNIADNNFVEEFEKILSEYNIDYVIPTHDSVALCLVENQDRFSAKIIAADLETTKICRYKSLTYSRLEKHGFCPERYTANFEELVYPVYLKPDDGQGGKDSYIVESYENLIYYLDRCPYHLICEYLPGDEVTVDCFTNRFGHLIFTAVRSRDRLLAGVSVHAQILSLDSSVKEIAENINSSLKFRGYWYFQLKKDKDGKYKLLEISTRLAGTACLTKQLDVNFPLLSILDMSDEDITILPNQMSIEVDRALFGRYNLGINYSSVYIDLDDTLIFSNGEYNTLAMMYLYQCLNKGVEIILITKHNGDLNEYLSHSSLPLSLFSEIIHLEEGELKYQHIDIQKNPIFIDNSFEERLSVRKHLDIPCFDVSNIECLLDWRG